MRGAAAHDLLYVSDRGEVYYYSYPQLKSVGNLSGFQALNGGLCSDSKGDVFVASQIGSGESSAIYEYAHGGTSPIATLSDPGIAFGCAVDPATGDLAVANYKDYSNPDDAGDVAVYSGGSGNPAIYYSADFSVFFFCGYDNHSNLFLSAEGVGSPNGEAVLVALPSGGTSLKRVSLDTQLYLGSAPSYPSVQWDGSHMTVSSFEESKALHGALADAVVTTKVLIYTLRISGSNATVIGTTRLKTVPTEHQHVGQVWIGGDTLIAPYTCCKAQQRVGLWTFPKGGQPRHSIEVTSGRLEMLWGLTISAGSSK